MPILKIWYKFAAFFKENKVVLLLAVVFGVSFVACTEQKPAEEAQEAAPAVEAVVDSAAAVVDSAAQAVVDSAAAPTQEAAPAEPAK